jgi:hypothetical protein
MQTRMFGVRVRRCACAVIAMALTLAAAASAPAADNGFSGALTITSVMPPTASGSVYVQGGYSVNHACSSPPGDFTYCGYYLIVSSVPQGGACRPDSLAWVQPGIYDHNQGQVPQSGHVSWNEHATSAPQAKTACLYTGDRVLIGFVNYTVPGTAPASTPAPTSSSNATVPPLTIADARANLTSILRDKFGGRFSSRRNFKRDCYRLTTQKVRCRVRWDHGSWRYSGAIDIRNNPDDPESSLLYATIVHRTRLHRASKPSGGSGPSSPTGPAPSHPTSSCDSSYSGACLKPNVSDYDCAGGSGDGPYYVQGPVRVVGDDHYGLDADGDGIGCE